jgi:type IV pilus assembly protein PilN
VTDARPQILINLLPHREERRRLRRTAFFAGLGVAALAGLLVVGVWYLIVQQTISGQQQRNDFLRAEIAKLEAEIKDVANLRAEIEALKARQRAVEDLQLDRNVPVHVLNELVQQTPEGVYFTSIRQDGASLAVVGVAQTNERVSEFLRNMSRSAQWLERPELQEIKASAANREQKRLSEFSVRLAIKRPSATPPADPARPATAAAAPGAVAAAKP